ncbi:hypothetical protein GCM10009582_34790 [Arthrobacter flavus]
MAVHLLQLVYPDRLVVIPDAPDGLAALMNAGEIPDNGIVWLDDLERYLSDASNLRSKWIERLQEAGNVIVATMRETFYESFQLGESLQRTQWATLQLFDLVRLKNESEERSALAAQIPDPRIRQGVITYGLGAYVGGGHLALQRLETGRTTNPVGAALVLAATDWQRSGIGDSIGDSIACALVPQYTDSDNLEPSPDELAAGWTWATAQVVGGDAFALLKRQADGSSRPFDYLLDHVSRSGRPIPALLWEAAAAADAPAGRLNTAGLNAVTAGYEQLAARFFERASEQGDVEAMANFATTLERGDRIPEAKALYERSAEGGSLQGMTGLAVLLEREGNVLQAERLFKKAAEGGIGDAMANLGFLLMGRGEEEEAVDWYRRAAEAGSGFGMTNYGIVLEKAGDIEAAEKLYRAAVQKRRNGAGMYQLAKLLSGRGKDEEALSLLQDATRAGNPAAMMELGTVFEARGEEAAAEKLYRMAADRGDAVGLFVVGRKLLAGQHYAEAERMFVRSAGRGYVMSTFWLGLLMQQTGRRAEAVLQFRSAAAHEAMTDVRTLLYIAQELEQEDALPVLRKAANLGSVFAMQQLGILLDRSEAHVEAQSFHDRATVGEERLRQSAGEGDTEALIELGQISADRRDFDQARRLLQKAADQGSAYALQCLALLPPEPGPL